MIYGRYPKTQEFYEERNSEQIWKTQKHLSCRVTRRVILKDKTEVQYRTKHDLVK